MEKGKKNRKQVIIGISVLLLVTLLLLGLTYAYYRTRIVGNTNSESISVTSENLSVTYQDGDSTLKTELVEPGNKFTKSFSVKNTGDAKASYSIILDKKENGFKRSEDWKYRLYKGDTTDTEPIAQGTIAVGSEQILYGKAEVEKDGIDNYVLEIEYVNLSNVDQSIDMGATLSFRVNIAEEKITWENAPEGTLLNAIKTNIDGMQDTPQTTPGKEASGEAEKVLAETQDDYGTSHYFRGNVDNNYLNFGNMCWRIVRVQGDGSIKIVAEDLTTKCENTSTPGNKAFIPTGRDDYASIYGNQESIQSYSESIVQNLNNTWFKNSSGLASMSSIKTDAEWCSDKSYQRDDSDPHYPKDTYIGKTRLDSPSLVCTSKDYLETSSIGILSADEYSFSGASHNSTNSYGSLGSHGISWTLTPAYYDLGAGANNLASDFKQYNTSYTLGGSWEYTRVAIAIRPALVLKSNTPVSGQGDGTKNNPYVTE